MYVFIPEYFAVKQLDVEMVRIFAQTYLCRGVRFFSDRGKWNLLQNYFTRSTYDRVHWLHILHDYSVRDEMDEVHATNALVFRENSHIILEIIQQIKHGAVIIAKFHNVSVEDIHFVAEDSDSFKFTVVEPLDLSQKKFPTGSKICRRKRLLSCESCGKEFDRPSLLKRHIRTHTGERPHVCETCGKGFSTSSSLNTHKRIHSGERPHECGMCGKRFTASSNLYYHRLTHSAEKPHKCDVCGKSFPTPGNLRSHVYSHGSVFPCKCNQCLRGTGRRAYEVHHSNLQNSGKL